MSGYFGDFAALEINTAAEGEPTYERLLCTTSLRINQARTRARVDCHGSANKQYKSGKPDFLFSADGNYDPASTSLFTALDSADAIPLRLTPYDDVDHVQWVGDCALENFEIEARQDQIITMNISGGAAEDMVRSLIAA